MRLLLLAACINGCKNNKKRVEQCNFNTCLNQSFTFLLVGLASFQAVFAQSAVAEKLSDDALLEKVQKQTFAYFWDFAHPVSGLARERSNTTFGYGNEVITTGGSGFGIMAIVTRRGKKMGHPGRSHRPAAENGEFFT